MSTILDAAQLNGEIVGAGEPIDSLSDEAARKRAYGDFYRAPRPTDGSSSPCPDRQNGSAKSTPRGSAERYPGVSSVDEPGDAGLTLSSAPSGHVRIDGELRGYSSPVSCVEPEHASPENTTSGQGSVFTAIPSDKPQPLGESAPLITDNGGRNILDVPTGLSQRANSDVAEQQALDNAPRSADYLRQPSAGPPTQLVARDLPYPARVSVPSLDRGASVALGYNGTGGHQQTDALEDQNFSIYSIPRFTDSIKATSLNNADLFITGSARNFGVSEVTSENSDHANEFTQNESMHALQLVDEFRLDDGGEASSAANDRSVSETPENSYGHTKNNSDAVGQKSEYRLRLDDHDVSESASVFQPQATTAPSVLTCAENFIGIKAGPSSKRPPKRYVNFTVVMVVILLSCLGLTALTLIARSFTDWASLTHLFTKSAPVSSSTRSAEPAIFPDPNLPRAGGGAATSEPAPESEPPAFATESCSKDTPTEAMSQANCSPLGSLRALAPSPAVPPGSDHRYDVQSGTVGMSEAPGNSSAAVLDPELTRSIEPGGGDVALPSTDQSSSKDLPSGAPYAERIGQNSVSTSPVSKIIPKANISGSRAKRSNATRAAGSFARLDTINAQAERLLSSGHVVEARGLFESAAASGDPRGARGIARTFDERVIGKFPASGTVPDREKSARWYQIAAEFEGQREKIGSSKSPDKH